MQLQALPDGFCGQSDTDADPYRSGEYSFVCRWYLQNFLTKTTTEMFAKVNFVHNSLREPHIENLGQVRFIIIGLLCGDCLKMAIPLQVGKGNVHRRERGSD